MEIRTRIAPSPTGVDLHIGNIYTGLLNFAYAKKFKGKFIIRIEDTDRERYIEGSEERILNSLKKFGLNYDEGPDIGGPYQPYRQSERLDLYYKYAQDLLDNNFAEFAYYPKDDAGKKKEYTGADKSDKLTEGAQRDGPRSVKDLVENKEKFNDWVVRMKVVGDEKVVFEDVIRGRIEFDSNQISKQVLLKSDGYPTYHLGVVVDDHLMEITHVIRAEEWISSTPKHVLLYKYFGWELPIFAHVPLLRNLDHSKLSKRKNPVWGSWYLENGYLPEAVLNYLTLLGWSHPEEKEIFSMDEFVELFELKDIHPVGPVFDLQKLTWVNGVYIREKLTDATLKNRLLELDPSIAKIPDFEKYIPLAKTRMKTLRDFKDLIQPRADIVLTDKQKVLAIELKSVYTNLKPWEASNISSATILVRDQLGSSTKDVYTVLTGRPEGLPFEQRLEVQGSADIVSWLDQITR